MRVKLVSAVLSMREKYKCDRVAVAGNRPVRVIACHFVTSSLIKDLSVTHNADSELIIGRYLRERAPTDY